MTRRRRCYHGLFGRNRSSLLTLDRSIAGPPCGERLLVEPEAFEALVVLDAADHQGQILQLRLGASRAPGVEQDRARIVLGQLLLDFPDQLSPFPEFSFHRLPVNQIVGLAVTSAGVVARRSCLAIRPRWLLVEPDVLHPVAV